MESRYIYIAAMVVFLPMLVVQSRMILYRSIKNKNHERRTPSESILEQLPHDLSIIGVILGFSSSNVIGDPFSSLPGFMSDQFSLLASAFAWVIPFILMSVIPLVQARQARMMLGALAYVFGAAAWISPLLLG
jgi:hypothetical protein